MTTVQSTYDKVFLLDAYAIIYRSYYAFLKNPRINSKGVNTSAIFMLGRYCLYLAGSRAEGRRSVARRFDFELGNRIRNIRRHHILQGKSWNQRLYRMRVYHCGSFNFCSKKRPQ